MHTTRFITQISAFGVFYLWLNARWHFILERGQIKKQKTEFMKIHMPTIQAVI